MKGGDFNLKHRKTFFTFLGTALLIGVGIGFGAAKLAAPAYPTGESATREGGFAFVNPLLSCDIAEDIEYPGFSALKSNLTRTVQSLIAAGDAKRISVYFRAMDSGAWTGVNQDDTFAPASLMKVPMLIAYLQSSETDPTLLSKSLFVPSASDQNAEETITSKNALALGQSYSIDKLLSAMIQSSDNNAASALNQAVATTSINSTYEQFDIPSASETNETMSPKIYMRIFRILYNASYLWRAKSQTALQLLSQTEFNQGIVAGVPAGTVVAHKFGERTIETGASTATATVEKRELHDCGIVYYAGSPYGICVMTEGTNFTDLETVIAKISAVTYNAVNQGILKGVE